jgi:hypothetical protein
LGIANHPSKIDEIIDRRCHIYTADEQSAELIAELLYRWANGNKKQWYDAQPGFSLRDTIHVNPIENGGYQTSISVYYAPAFTKGLHKLTEKYISPDKSFTR